MKGLAAFVMKERWQAVLVIAGLVCLSFMIPLVGLLSSAALGLVVLRQGLPAAATVLALSAAAVAVFGGVVLGSVAAPLIYALLLWFPTAVAAWVLRISRRIEWALTSVVVPALMAVLAVYGLIGDPSEFWNEKLIRLVQPLLDQAPDGLDADGARFGLRVAAHYATGFVSAGSALSVFLTLMLARWWQSLLYNPGGFRAEFVELRPAPAFAYAALACIGGAMSLPAVAELLWNLGLVFFVLYLMVGVAVIHVLLSRRSAGKFWLAGFYLLLFVIPQVALPVALMGFTDVWMDWRHRRAAGV
ncbi:YybS family protein [Methylococcus capsulatus]|uniref:YybS family protein n=1 Tax=Methylococcus capsulatus TaxID=414 RepID=UPI002017D720|nr:YybS family protein [Methylococcus capsulatus]UQN12343.1 YybS family protein [Methylococcus capsulatus]